MSLSPSSPELLWFTRPLLGCGVLVAATTFSATRGSIPSSRVIAIVFSFHVCNLLPASLPARRLAAARLTARPRPWVHA